VESFSAPRTVRLNSAANKSRFASGSRERATIKERRAFLRSNYTRRGSRYRRLLIYETPYFYIGKSRRAAADFSAIIIQFRRGRGNYFAWTRVAIPCALLFRSPRTISLSLSCSRCLFRPWIDAGERSVSFRDIPTGSFPRGTGKSRALPIRLGSFRITSEYSFGVTLLLARAVFSVVVVVVNRRSLFHSFSITER